MKRNKSILLLAIITFSLLFGCASSSDSPQHTVTLIAKSTETEFWLSVFAGAEAAATEYNMKLNIVGPETEEDFETQNDMVEEAMENGTEALIFSAIHYAKNSEAIDAAAKAASKSWPLTATWIPTQSAPTSAPTTTRPDVWLLRLRWDEWKAI